MRLRSSAVSPDHDSAMITSSGVIMPRSPWLASAACTKKAGVPVEASVAAILRPICPDLPRPVTMTRPLALRIRSVAAANGAPRPFCSVAISAATPSASAASVRSADSMAGERDAERAAGCGLEEAIHDVRKAGGDGRLLGIFFSTLNHIRRLERGLFNGSLTIVVLTLLTAFPVGAPFR